MSKKVRRVALVSRISGSVIGDLKPVGVTREEMEKQIKNNSAALVVQTQTVSSEEEATSEALQESGEAEVLYPKKRSGSDKKETIPVGGRNEAEPRSGDWAEPRSGEAEKGK